MRNHPPTEPLFAPESSTPRILRSRGPVLVAVLVSILLLGGCGGGESAPEAGTSTDATETSQRSEARSTPGDAQDSEAPPAAPGRQELIRAALEGRAKVVRRGLEAGLSPDATDGRGTGNTPLMVAAYNGHTEIVRLLLEEGAQIGVRNAEGRTALMFASTGSFPETVALLLRHGADPNATDEGEGWSALMFAAAEGHGEVVRTLLEGGADPSLTDRDGETARTFAENNGHAEVAGLLP